MRHAATCIVYNQCDFLQQRQVRRPAGMSLRISDSLMTEGEKSR